MSGSSGKQITCRGCGESVPADGDNCHHCGTSIRSITGPALAILFGGILFVAAVGHGVINGEWNLLVYGIIGLVMSAVGGYIIYEKRQRITTVDPTPEA